MFKFQFYKLLFFAFVAGCTSFHKNSSHALNSCIGSTETDSACKYNFGIMNSALLGTRFHSLDELKTVIQIEYYNNNTDVDSVIHKNAKVVLTHCSNGKEVTAELAAGTSEGDINKASLGDFKEQFAFIFKSPYSVANRKDLNRIFLLARLRPALFGEGDVAFFNIAQTQVKNINTKELAFVNAKDSTEKGYLNTFNHITAQAFITSCFSEELADFVADAHERHHHPELILGKFTEERLNDLAEGPVDNYVDVINNEWGQELGKQLKEKYHLNRETYWTPELLANYLNDMQSYYSWAFQIGFRPFKSEDEQIIKFARKMNAVMKGVSSSE